MAGVGGGEAGVVIYRYLPCAIHENGQAEALLDREERVLTLRSASLQPGHGGGDMCPGSLAGQVPVPVPLIIHPGPRLYTKRWSFRMKWPAITS